MPQVDLETLVSSVCSGGSDRKIACETLAADDPSPARPRPDFPPESFYISKDAEINWLDQNAFYERKESQKGNKNNPASNSNANSQRISLKSKALMIGLPKPQKRCFNETKNRRHQCRIAKTLMFPKRIGSRSKKDPPLTEPSSPKVSCMGKVRSKREKSLRIQRLKSGRVNSVSEKSGRVKKPGLFASFRAMFRPSGGCKDLSSTGGEVQPPAMEWIKSNDIRSRLPPDEPSWVPPSESPSRPRRSSEGDLGLPGLGGMKRFTSGRKGDMLVDV